MGKGFISPSHFFFEVLIMLIKDNHLLLDKSERVDSFMNESVEISESESNASEQFVPVIESKYSTERYINIKDIKDLSENTGKPYYECIDNIISYNNLSNPVFIVNESDYIESDTIREMTKIISENSLVKSVPLSNSNPVYICANEAINSIAYDGDSSLLEAFVEGDFGQFYSILDESSRWMKETMKKQAQELVDKGQAPDLATANRIIEKEHGRKREENDATRVALERERFWSRRSRTPSDTAGYYVQTKTNMHGQQYKNNGRGFIQTSGSKRQYAKKGTYGKQPDKNALSNAGTFKSDDGTFYGSHPNGDTVGKPDYNQSPDDYRFQKEKELDQKRKEQEEEKRKKEQEELARKQKTEDEQKATEQQQTQQTTQNTHDATNSSSQNDDKTDTTKNQENAGQKQPVEPPDKQEQSQQQDQQKEKQVESTINNIEKEAENKPAGFISSKIAALRKLYQNWLAKKNQEKDQGKIGFFSNILRVITNCIDRLLAKLQGVKKAENNATGNNNTTGSSNTNATTPQQQNP